MESAQCHRQAQVSLWEFRGESLPTEEVGNRHDWQHWNWTLEKGMSVEDGGKLPGGGIENNREMRNLMFPSVPSFLLHAAGPLGQLSFSPSLLGKARPFSIYFPTSNSFVLR